MSGQIKQWHERIEGEMNGDSTFKAMKAEINELRAALVTATKAPPASSNLLTAARHYASSYLQQERDDPKLCCDEQHHGDVCALFAAIEGEEGSDWVERHITPKGPSTGWCTKCGCGNDSADYAHLPACPSAIAATKEGA